MEVLLRTRGKQHDITGFVNFPIQQSKSIEIGTFNSAVLKINSIDKDALLGIDLSRRIPVNSIVEITDFEETNQYYVRSADVINKGNDNEHTLTLVELSTILEERPIPDFSSTQPRSESIIIREDSKQLSTLNVRINTPGVKEFAIPMTITNVSNDINVIEDGILKEDGGYKISTTVNFDRLIIDTPYGYLQNAAVVVKIGGVEEGRLDIGLLYSEDMPEKYTLTINYDNIGVNEVEVFIEGERLSTFVDIRVKDSYMNIEYDEAQVGKDIYISDIVEKLLQLPNVGATPEIKLEESTRSKLETILMYDRMFTDQTLYTALNEIAGYVKAKLKVYMIDDQKWLKFIFISDLSNREYIDLEIPVKNSTQQTNELASSLSIKNNNVINSDYNVELHTLRTIDDSIRLTTDNIGLIADRPYDKVKKLYAGGIEIKDINGNVVLEKTDRLNIAPRVVEKAYYDVLDKMAYYNDRSINSQNNHLYFERGKRGIYGMSFVGVQYEKWTTNVEVRALYETMAAQLEDNLGVEIAMNDKGIVYDDEMSFVIEYYSLSNSNANILKDDQSGFEEKLIKKINATDKVNNADLLGTFIREKVNATGGTQIAKSGYVTTIDQMPKLGTVDGDGYKVVSILKHSNDGEMDVRITLVKDYVFESPYVGINSDRRIFEIDKIDMVDRVDKSLNKVILNIDVETSNDTGINIDKAFKILENNTDIKPPKIARLDIDSTLLTKNIETQSVGTTIEWIIEMEDNYSAGNRRKKTQDDIRYLEGVSYTDLFGNANNLTVNYYSDYSNTLKPTISELNNLPLGQPAVEINYGTLTYQLNKDSRERIIISNQLSFTAKNENIYIYNGLAKYSNFGNNETSYVTLCMLNYTPNRDDKYVDIGRVENIDNTTVVYNDHIEVTLPRTSNYGWYNTVTKELILVVLKGISGNNNIYFKGEKEAFNRRGEQYIQRELSNLNTSLTIGSVVKDSIGVNDKIVSNVTVDSDLELGDDYVYESNTVVGINNVIKDSLGVNDKIVSEIAVNKDYTAN